MKPIENQYINSKKAAEVAGMSPENFAYYLARGRGPDVALIIDNKKYFTESAVIAWRAALTRKNARQIQP